MKNKVVFVSIANAIAIIAVIIGHLDITGCNNDPNTPVANIIGAFGSFQMPLFMRKLKVFSLIPMVSAICF